MENNNTSFVESIPEQYDTHLGPLLFEFSGRDLAMRLADRLPVNGMVLEIACAGPVLASILALAATTTTIFQGAFLLTIFSIGLAVPFLVIAAGIGSIAPRLTKLEKYLNWVSIVGGVFLVFVLLQRVHN